MSLISTVLERNRSRNSLVCLLQGVEKRRVTIEFRDNTAVEGMLNSVDCYMNMDMCDVTLYPRHANKRRLQPPIKLEQFFVNGKHIRYVHLPEHLDVVGVLQRQVKQLTKLRTAKRNEKQPTTRQ